MTAHWQKLGLVFLPRGEGGWMKTHAQVPTPLIRAEEGIIRVYFASRPTSNLSLTTYCDLDIDDPMRIVHVNSSPILECGQPGTFDEHGIMPSCAIDADGAIFLYYSGWSRGASVPYTNATGLAISEDGGRTFKKYSAGPILARNIHDPFSATSPCVIKSERDWHMWYCSGTGWPLIDGKHEHVYDIKEAVSSDGISWRPTGHITLSTNSNEQALTRPWVMPLGSQWRLWYCHRQAHDFRDGTGAYRIASASSPDLASWRRLGPDGPQKSVGGWDSLAQAYPSVLRVGSTLLMFYNGNGFGASGFGICITGIEATGLIL